MFTRACRKTIIAQLGRDSKGHCPLAGCGTASHIAFKRPARGEFSNSPQDCLKRGDALQERASPKKISCCNFFDRLGRAMLAHNFGTKFSFSDNRERVIPIFLCNYLKINIHNRPTNAAIYSAPKIPRNIHIPFLLFFL